MSLITFIYLISFFGTLKTVLGFVLPTLSFFTIFFIIFGSLTLVELGFDIKAILTKAIKYYLLSTGILLFLFVIVPSEKVMYAMLAVNVGEDIYKSETAQKGIELLDLKLDQLIKETKDKINN